MKKYQPLSVEEITKFLNVDLDSGICKWKNVSKYHNKLNGTIAGFPKKKKEKVYWIIKINGCQYRRAQLILTVATGIWPSDSVDHIDGNSLNDKSSNLRHATITQNNWNHRTRKKKSSLPMGVKILPSGKYQARISVNKKHISLGTYDSPEKAHEVYKCARKENFGDFC